jgi:RimJ/RimL family protein N-acetyltransferase
MHESGLLLRAVVPADLEHFFAQERDPVARQMAAFTSEDPDDRAAFDAHWARILADPATVNRTIECDGAPAGNIAAFEQFGAREISYWIDRALWGRGVATRAVRLFLAELPERPLHARAAADNVASIRVLTKCSFVFEREERGFAAARGAEIDEHVFRLDR